MPDRILIVQYSANLDGSALSGLLLANGLRDAGWAPHVAFGFDGPVVARYRAEGHAVSVVPHKSWLRTARHVGFARVLAEEAAAARRMMHALDEVRPRAVYVNTAVSLAGALAAARRGLPCVWHLRELFEDVGGEMRVPPGLKRAARRVIRRLADRIVVNSRAVAANMLGADPRGRVHVVPNAVGDAFFEVDVPAARARQRFGLPADGPVLGVPGTLRPMKGHPFLFETVPALAAACPGLTVAVTGTPGSAYAQDLLAQVARLGANEVVRFLGSVEDMPAFYRACDAVCVPSVAEPFGRTVIEAFAVGTPVVATAVGGIREIVEDGRTGLLVPYGDTAALATALRRVLRDETLAETLRRNALRKAKAVYPEHVYQSRLNRIVAEAAGVPSAPAAASAADAARRPIPSADEPTLS